jgi:hypothetical protein
VRRAEAAAGVAELVPFGLRPSDFFRISGFGYELVPLKVARNPAPSIMSMRINTFDDKVRKISKIFHSLALFVRGTRIVERNPKSDCRRKRRRIRFWEAIAAETSETNFSFCFDILTSRKQLMN